MTAELYPGTFEPAEAVVLTHLFPLEGAADALGSRRWIAGGRMPYRWVNRIATVDADEFTDGAIVRIHTLAATYTDAARESIRTDRRMLLLVNDPEYPLILPGTGRQISLEECTIRELGHEEPYVAESVATRFVSEYLLDLSTVAV